MTKKGKEIVKREGSRTLPHFGDIEHWFEDMWKRPLSMLRAPFWPDMKFEGYDISPSIDIYETDKELVVKADLPGLEKDDIQVDITADLLTISGEKKKEEKVEKEDYYRYERSFGSFRRRFELPSHVDTEKVTASFKNGVLELKIPRSKEAEKKHKKITIE
ncbi:MAG: Hsp20/alpha crystallin family protein [Nitrospirota bacterium]|nr:MAG: Hsp20/alpha crystallin family protein [Nitrospirota bacterium]